MIILASNKYKPHFGGIENSLYFLSKEYQKLNHEVVILADDRSLVKYERLPHFEKEGEVTIIRYKSYFPKFYIDHLIKPFIDIHRVKKIFQKLKKENENISVLGRHPTPIIGALLAKLKVNYLVPGIMKTQMKILSGSKFNIKGFLIEYVVIRFNSYFQKISLKKSSNVLAFSENMKQQIQDLVGEKVNIDLVSAGVDSSRFKPNNGIKKKDLLGVTEDSFVFLAVGRLIKDKGVDYAIKSFARIENKNSFLVVVGDGIEKDNLKNIAEDLKVSDRVIFVGKVLVGIERYYQVSDCFLMSSVMEPFGQTILEALATGLPVIAWESSEKIKTASSEILGKENGYLVDFGTENMAQAMNDLMSLDEESYHKLSNNNVQFVNDCYSWKSLALKNLSL